MSHHTKPEKTPVASRTILLVWGNGRGVGGTERRMAEVVGWFADHGHQVVSAFLAKEKETPLTRLLHASGSELETGCRTGDIRRLVATLNPCLVIAFGLRASGAVRAAKALHLGHFGEWPTVVDARNGLEALRSNWLWVLDRVTQRFVDIFLANSDAVACQLERRGLKRVRIRTLYSALGEEWYAAGSEELERVKVVMVGNSRPEKRHQLGIDAFLQIGPPMNLVIYTDDATRLRRYLSASERGSFPEVQFVEGRALGPADYDAAAVLLHPSSHESAPRAVMEARARGCRVVAFDVGDTRRIIAPSEKYLVADGKTEQLALSLAAALKDPRSSIVDTPARYCTVGEYANELLMFARGRT